MKFGQAGVEHRKLNDDDQQSDSRHRQAGQDGPRREDPAHPAVQAIQETTGINAAKADAQHVGKRVATPLAPLEQVTVSELFTLARRVRHDERIAVRSADEFVNYVGGNSLWAKLRLKSPSDIFQAGSTVQLPEHREFFWFEPKVLQANRVLDHDLVATKMLASLDLKIPAQTKRQRACGDGTQSQNDTSVRMASTRSRNQT
jgi:hypothetical protein